MTNEKKTPWIGYLIIGALLFFFFKACFSGDEKVPTKETIQAPKIQSGIKLEFLDRTECTSFRQFTDGSSGDMTNRAFIYQVSNFDKTNEQCWLDLENFAKHIAPAKDKDSVMAMVMVYFMNKQDDLKYWKRSNGCDFEWDYDNDSFWIGNYIYSDRIKSQMVRGWKEVGLE